MTMQTQIDGDFRSFLSKHVCRPIYEYITNNPKESITEELLLKIIYSETNGEKSNQAAQTTNKKDNKRKPCKWKSTNESCPKTTADPSGFCASCKRRKEVKDIIENQKRMKVQELKYSTGTDDEIKNGVDETIFEEEPLNIEMIDPAILLYKDLDTECLIQKTNKGAYEVVGKLVLDSNEIIDLSENEINKYEKKNIKYSRNNNLTLFNITNVDSPSIVPDL